MTSVLMDVSFVLGLAIWSAGLGLAILSALDSVPVYRSDALSLALPLGLGTLALAALALGEIGWLTIGGIAAIWLIGLLIATFALRRHPFLSRETDRRPDRRRTHGDRLELSSVWLRLVGSNPIKNHQARSGLDQVITALIVLALIGTFLTALTPVTDGDALCYHLQVPKVFLQAHAVTFDPDLHETIYPLLTEMLYAVALAARSPVACRLVQWLLGVSFAGLVVAMARPSLGDSRARWAGAVALLVPAITNGMGAPLNDVALAAFCNASIVAALCYRTKPTFKRVLLSGLFTGLAIGVKYPALVLATLLIPVLWIRKETWIANIKHVLTFGSVAMLIGCGWYLRAYVHTGNPVYPFFRNVFGGAGLDEVLDPIKRPLAVTVWNLLTSLGPMTLDPDRFDSLSHQFGPVFLLFLPALLIEKTPKRVLGIVGIGYAFLLICLTQRQSMRFVLTAVGPLSVGVGWLASTWWDRRGVAARSLVSLLLVSLIFETGLALARARHVVPVLLGRESSQAFLDRREPTSRVGRWVGDHLPDSSRMIGQDHRGYYFPVAYTMELAHRRRTGLASRGESAQEVIATLRDRGFTHLLLCPPEPETAVEFDPTLSRHLSAWVDEHPPIYHEAITDGDGILRRYAIYDLGGAVMR